MSDLRDALVDWYEDPKVRMPSRGYDFADLLLAALERAGFDTDIERVPAEPIPAVGVLRRTEDVTGLSGTGVVAWVVEFPDGPCVVRWCVSEVRQTAVFASIEDVMAVHGHDGRTSFEWHGPYPNQVWPA